jgi:hypothetical protein
LLRAVVALLGAGLLWAPAALATGAVTRSGTTITVDFGETDEIDSFIVHTVGSTMQLEDDSFDGGNLTNSGALGCVQNGLRQVDCNASGVDTLVVRLGPGEDLTSFETFGVNVDVEVYGEEGADPQLWGTGRDDQIDGGPGDDELDGFGGDDVIRGGSGDDILSGQAESDEIFGGSGFDVVDFTGAPLTVNVSLDDQPGDGPAGDNDNIHSDVEDIVGTSGNDVIRGSALGNDLRGLSGNDIIDGGLGADIIDAGAGDDSVTSRDGLAELVDCGGGTDTVVADDVDVTDGCEIEHRSAALQTDVDGDGAARPLDCDDRNAAIHPGAADAPDDGIDQNCDGADATDLDRDDDGFPRPLDCDDRNARAHPGARERPGNRVDEDCNGRAEPLEPLTNGVPNAWSTQGALTRNLRLGVRDVRRGMKVELRCRGGGCPFARKTRSVKKRKRLLDLHPLLAGAALRAGAVLELRITRRGAIGKVVRYGMRSGAVPSSRALCLPPGKRRPRAC